ncbi:LEA type 2 family protein [Polaribacter sp. Z014]|uniref:LEA type 2 family protein n=1 Tax=unclassified Polaribacter TaxID=196858 RepID=UPI00193BB9CB|nr:MULTISPECIES: LEA type 2 family protein [unclassified Polaribacter]MCL7762858.1 LEA type 2 family protein [Polaribacter sp. Z014]QVY65711.1 LEA type 2 family protein [Polaribacter sp. Q13]
MKKLLYFILLFTLIISCSVKEQPIFIKVDNVKVSSFRGDTIRLKAAAFFENPNDVGGKISTDEIKVIVNGAEVAQVSSEEFEVPARKEFSIPLTVIIPAKKIFDNNKNGILGGLLNSFLNKSIKVQFKGDIKYKVFGYSSVYPVDEIQEIKF